MKEFDLELAKKGAEICTRDGKNARVICFDRKNHPSPILALIEEEDGETLRTYNINGRYWNDINDSDNDLMLADRKYEGYVNVYRYDNFYRLGEIIYDNEELAIEKVSDPESYITTIKVKWED